MWASALLQTSLVLWLAQQTLQAGIKPINWATKDVGIVPGPDAVPTGLKPGGIPNPAAWYGNKAMKTGIGRPWTKFGGGNIRVIGVTGRVQRPVPWGRSCFDCNGGRTRFKPRIPTGMTFKEKLNGFGGGGYMGASQGAVGYGAGLGQGGHLGDAAGKHGRYGEPATGYTGAGAGNGYGYANGYSNGHGYGAELADGAERKSGKRTGLGPGGYAGHGQGVYGGVGTGLDTAGHTYGGGDTYQDAYPVIYPETKLNGMNGGLKNGYKG